MPPGQGTRAMAADTRVAADTPAAAADTPEAAADTPEVAADIPAVEGAAAASAFRVSAASAFRVSAAWGAGAEIAADRRAAERRLPTRARCDGRAPAPSWTP